MNKHHHLYLGCFLNRIALHCNCNPLIANPIKVLKDLFSFGDAAAQTAAFDDFCMAALKDHYDWKNGSPANGLFYGERLELLIEAAYLIHSKAGKYRVKKRRAATISITSIPVFLTNAEFQDPLTFFEKFFTLAAIAHWKKLLNAFTNAAISNSGVSDDVELPEVFLFSTNIKKLFHAAARLVALFEDPL